MINYLEYLESIREYLEILSDDKSFYTLQNADQMIKVGLKLREIINLSVSIKNYIVGFAKENRFGIETLKKLGIKLKTPFKKESEFWKLWKS